MSRTDVGDVPVSAFAEREHRDLDRGLDRIHLVASEMARRPTPELSSLVLGVLNWLHSTLDPHIAWEEAAAYPEIDIRAGTTWATRSARLEHRQIRARIARIQRDWVSLHDAAHPDGRTEAQANLFALEALLRAHLDTEEELLIPVLAEATAIEPDALAGSMAPG
jgi:iron-sulfur cluster repair protein YtfE (RIC family)